MLRMLGRPVFSQLSISLLPVASCEYLWMEIRPGPRFGLPLDLALQRVAEIAASEELRKAWIGSDHGSEHCQTLPFWTWDKIIEETWRNQTKRKAKRKHIQAVYAVSRLPPQAVGADYADLFQFRVQHTQFAEIEDTTLSFAPIWRERAKYRRSTARTAAFSVFAYTLIVESGKPKWTCTYTGPCTYAIKNASATGIVDPFFSEGISIYFNIFQWAPTGAAYVAGCKELGATLRAGATCYQPTECRPLEDIFCCLNQV